MIYTEIANIGHYQGLGKYLDKAVAYLGSHPLEGVRAGHYDIDGNMVYMNVFDYETIPEEKDLMEVDGPVEHYIKLIPGKALITLPEDAHKVKLAVGSPSAVKKAVIKVYVGE